MAAAHAVVRFLRSQLHQAAMVPNINDFAALANPLHIGHCSKAKSIKIIPGTVRCRYKAGGVSHHLTAERLLPTGPQPARHWD